MKLASEKRYTTHRGNKTETEKRIEDYIEREFAVAAMRLVDPQTAMKEGQENLGNAENAGLTTRKPKKPLGSCSMLSETV
jgi:cell division protein FtsX